MLLFGFSLTWIFAIIGLSTSNAETAQAASFPILAPLVFASSAFVPVNSMPGWLQAFAKNQPVSIAIDAVRAELAAAFPDVENPPSTESWNVLAVAAG